MLKNTYERSRFIKFALVGVSGTIVDFLFFNLFIWLGFASIIASMFSFIIAVFNNFFWNRIWTYPESRELPIIAQFGKFSVVSVIGLAIRTTILLLIESPLIGAISLLIPADFVIAPELIGKNTSLAVVIVIVLFWNYFGNKLWTYRGTVS